MEQHNIAFSIPSMRQIKRVHFIGIGGVGMGGIAEVLLSLGYVVTGSDPAQSAMTARLKSLGAQINHNHVAQNVIEADVVVISSAIGSDNVEIQKAKELRIPIVPRATMLAELMRFRYSVAIAGTHGKTTTTSFVTTLFNEGGLDPTYVIGGKLNSSGTNACLGAGRYLVAEADESDASFLQLHPMVAIVTNIDTDHLATYDNNFDKLKEAFVTFLHRLPFYGYAVLCIDCSHVREILPLAERPVLTYGFHPEADYRASDFQQNGLYAEFKVHRPNREPLSIKLNLPGFHNVCNALAAIAVATEEGVSDQAIVQGFVNFAGIGRRFHLHGEYAVKEGSVSVVEDYGHHPEEIRATIEAARLVWPQKRLVMAFQPHRYTRTQSLFAEFAQVLSKVDELILLDVYSAGESPIAGADSQSLCRLIENTSGLQPTLVPTVTTLRQALSPLLQKEDVLLLQGAGNIGAFAKELVVPPEMAKVV